MTAIIGILISILVLALIVVVVLWVIDLVASAIGFPGKAVAIIKAIVILIALLVFLQMIFGGGWLVPYHLNLR